MAMKSILIYSLIASCLLACNAFDEKPDEHLMAGIPESKAPGVIPPDVELNSIVSFPARHTWRDLHDFYQNELPKFSRTDYYDNLRELTLFHLVKPFKFQVEADKETLEYYFREMQQVDLMDPDAFLAVAAALFLKGWSKEEVREAARARFEKNMETFKTFANPEQALEKYGEKHQKLLRFANNFPNRWGSY